MSDKIEMDVIIKNYSFGGNIEYQVREKIYQRIDEMVSKYLDGLDLTRIGYLIEKRIAEGLEYGAMSNGVDKVCKEDGPMIKMFNEKLTRIADNIKDEDLKKFLYESILCRVSPDAQRREME